jgi:signal transduction histidine kinase
MVMFLLVLVRMSGLLDEVESQHDQLQTAFSDLELAQSERKLLLDRTVHAAEEERIRLAANLHDGPIQRLASVSLTLDRAMLRLDRGDPVVAGDLLERGQDELQAEVDALRRMMSELRPPILDEAGFEAGVRDLVDDFAQRTGVGGQVGGALLTPLPPDTETALYRVLQEALWNVAKHAGATSVEVELQDLGGTVELCVTDDGTGFHPASSTSLLRDGHFGLVGMRERLESTGGLLIVESVPGAGTRLTARVPRAADQGRLVRTLEGAA